MSNFDVLNTNRFDDAALKGSVDSDTYSAWHNAISDGSALPKANSKVLANAIKDWALERGAVNFSHWFFPHRAMKAGTKLDAFIDLDFGSDQALKPIVGKDFSASKVCSSARRCSPACLLRIASRKPPTVTNPWAALTVPALASHSSLPRRRTAPPSPTEASAPRTLLPPS
jgi:hypothetical protein